MTTIETLLAYLDSPDRDMRLNAAIDLRDHGDSARPAIPALKRLLDDKSEPYLQIVAAGTIGKIAKEDPDAVQVLVTALKDPRGLNRATACELLGERRHKSGVLNTMSLLGDPEFDVRFAAAKALGRTFSNWHHAVAVCLVMLKDHSTSNRATGVECLLSIRRYVQNDLDLLEMAMVDASREFKIELEAILVELRK